MNKDKSLASCSAPLFRFLIRITTKTSFFWYLRHDSCFPVGHEPVVFVERRRHVKNHHFLKWSHSGTNESGGKINKASVFCTGGLHISPLHLPALWRPCGPVTVIKPQTPLRYSSEAMSTGKMKHRNLSCSSVWSENKRVSQSSVTQDCFSCNNQADIIPLRAQGGFRKNK